MTEKDALSPNQKRALWAILENRTILAASAAAQLTPRTLHRYLADPVFKAELHRLLDGRVLQAAAALAGLSGDAIKALAQVVNNLESKDSDKVRAASVVLEQSRKTAELNILAARVAELEDMLNEREIES